MTIKSIQKVIKVGDSLAVTLPARDAKAAGIKAGDQLEITGKPVVSSKKPKLNKVEAEYEEFKKQYGQTLENLADR